MANAPTRGILVDLDRLHANARRYWGDVVDACERRALDPVAVVRGDEDEEPECSCVSYHAATGALWALADALGRDAWDLLRDAGVDAFADVADDAEEDPLDTDDPRLDLANAVAFGRSA